MKRNTVKLELQRAFQSKGFILAVLFGLVVVSVHLYKVISLYYEIKPFSPDYHMFLIGNAFGNSFSMYTMFNSFEQYYYFCLPLLVILPHGSSFYRDLRDGYARNMIIKVGKQSYLQAKYIASFLSGGVAVLLPIVFNFLVVAMFFPMSVPVYQNIPPGVPDGFLMNVYYSKPMLYMLAYWGILFVFCGFVATLPLLLSLLTEFRFAILISPFIFFVAFYMITNLYWIPEWNPLIFVQAMQSNGTVYPIPIIIWFIVLYLITYPLYLFIGKRRKVW